MSGSVERPDFKGRSGLLDAVERLNEAIDQKDAELAKLREVLRVMEDKARTFNDLWNKDEVELARLRPALMWYAEHSPGGTANIARNALRETT